MGVKARGTSRDYALLRLEREAPDLHAEVVAGNLSAHAAMVRAGLQPRRFTVVARNADWIAATLRRQLPPDVLAEVVAKLTA